MERNQGFFGVFFRRETDALEGPQLGIPGRLLQSPTGELHRLLKFSGPQSRRDGGDLIPRGLAENPDGENQSGERAESSHQGHRFNYR
jgi:hypothetical protein